MTNQERAKAAVEWLRGSDLDCRGVELCDSLIELLHPIAAETHVIVPIEPTEKIMRAGENCIVHGAIQGRRIDKAYRAMIAASLEGEK